MRGDMEAEEQKADAVGTAKIVLPALVGTGQGTVLTPTLHVSLMWTDLADFVEHFEREIRGAKASRILGDDTGWLLWDFERYPDDPNIQGLIDNKKYTRVTTFHVGTTGKNYWITDGIYGHPLALRAVVQVARFSRRRLKVALHEREGGGHAERLKRWLDDRWGKDVEADELAKAAELPTPPERLTERQKEVAKLTTDGLTQKQIANELCIGVDTVKVHKRDIRQTLGLGKGGSLKQKLKDMRLEY